MTNKAPMTNDQGKSKWSSRWSLGIDPWSLIGHWVLVIGVCLTAGCIGKPNQANVQLRKENQELHDQISTLRQERDAARAAVTGMSAQATTLPSLPPDRLAKLFTTTGIELGRLTGG